MPKSLSITDALARAGRQLQNEHPDRPIPLADLVDQVARECEGSPASATPADHCYDRRNAGIRRDNRPMFIHEADGNYRFLGEHHPFTGRVIQHPKGREPHQHGKWVEGKLTWFPGSDERRRGCGI